MGNPDLLWPSFGVRVWHAMLRQKGRNKIVARSVMAANVFKPQASMKLALADAGL